MWNVIKGRFWSIFGVIIIAVIIIAVISGNTTGGNFISDTVGVVVSPFQGAFSWAIGNIGGGFQYLGDLGGLHKENTTLKDRVSQLESEQRTLDSFAMENERLRALLELKERQKEFDTIGAEIIGRNASNYSDVFTIDKGSLSGIRQNAAVLSSDGLVGYVLEVGTTWAKVLTILDANSSVGVLMPRTGEQSLIQGIGEPYQDFYCRMTYLPADANIMVGDSVETSGLGEIYPKGIYVGKIKEITKDSNGLSKGAIVESATNFARLHEVLVVK